MTIIRTKVSQNFTIINNSVINDKEFDTKYLGTFLRLISKDENWEISVEGLAKLYPSNGVDYYRNALKHMCKLGYLIRMRPPKVKGKFQKVVMQLYDSRQIDTPLSDENVNKLWAKDDLSEDEIQKIYPKRVSPHGQPEADKQTQQRTEEQRIEKQLSVADKPVGLPPEKIKIKSGDGKQQEILQSDLHRMAVIKGKNWNTQEIVSAWKILSEYDNIVHDWFRFIEGTIENFRKATKSKRASEGWANRNSKHNSKYKENESCNRKIANPQETCKEESSEIDTSEHPLQKSPISLGEALERSRNGLPPIPEVS